MTYYSTSWLDQHNRVIRLCLITGRGASPQILCELKVRSRPVERLMGVRIGLSQTIGSNSCNLEPSLQSQNGETSINSRKSVWDSVAHAACSN